MSHESLYQKAHAAGVAAGDAAVPSPMVVFERESPFDDSSPVVKVYEPIMEGPCGFAYVLIRPGTHPFAKYLRKVGLSHKAYYGGEEMSVRMFGQSVERKYAYAQAFAAVLQEAGVKAYASSRLD